MRKGSNIAEIKARTAEEVFTLIKRRHVSRVPLMVI